MLDSVLDLKTNYEAVKNRIVQAAKQVSRDPQEVQILAISKLQNQETILGAYHAGIKTFGENYVEEALPKMESLADLVDISWEMIGHVQSRKAKLVANHFKRVHSLDSLKLARLLNDHRDPALAPLEVLMQVNLSGEESKQGIKATQREDWEDIFAFAKQLKDYQNLRLTGLMTMPPLYSNPEENQPFFRQLRELKEYLNEKEPSFALKELSMGTSHDFEIAVQEGATIVRLGSILLGQRKSRKV